MDNTEENVVMETEIISPDSVGIVEAVPVENEKSKGNKKDLEAFGNEEDIFSRPEIEQLNAVREIRSRMISQMVGDGIPDNPRDIRLLNELLTAQESGIHSRVGSRLKKQEISNAEMAKDQIIQILKQVRVSGEFIDVEATAPKANREIKSVEVNLVDGHTSLVENSNIAEEFLAKYEGGK